jgi:hypothetical protein
MRRFERKAIFARLGDETRRRSMERLPTEKAMAEQTRKFEAIAFG